MTKPRNPNKKKTKLNNRATRLERRQHHFDTDKTIQGATRGSFHRPGSQKK